MDGFPKGGEAGDGTTEVDDMDLLALQLQPIIDQMVAEGINKIILQSHLQTLPRCVNCWSAMDSSHERPVPIALLSRPFLHRALRI